MITPRNRHLNRLLIIVALLLPLIRTPLRATEYLPVVSSIDVAGNETIEESTIRYSIRSQVGEPVDQSQIRRDIKALYRTGFFDDIRVTGEISRDRIRLIYTVKERLIINEVLITGAKKIQVNTLNDEITVEKGKRYDPSRIQESCNKIIAKYLEKGYNYAFVTPRLTPAGSGSASLILAVDEGTKVRIEQINFTGNSKIDDGNRLFGLKAQLKENREHWWMSWLTSGGKFKEDLLRDDLKKVEEYYKNHGFLRISVGEPKIVVNKPDISLSDSGKKPRITVSITIPIVEGDVYTLGEITAKAADESIFKPEVILSVVKATRLEKYQKFLGGSAFFKAGPRVESGQTYSYAIEQEAITQLSELYGARGYIYTMIDPVKTIHEDTHTVDLCFTVSEGTQAFLHRLEFRGNLRTRDRVLRRNVLLAEGEILNTALLKQAISRIQYLGYIEDVKPEVQPQVDASKVDVTISLNDTKQTEIQLAGGYSGYEGLYGTLGLSEHNLFGRGQDFSFSFTSGKRRQTFQLSFSDDWIFDRPYYGAASIWNTIRDFEYSKRKTIGSSITTGKSLGHSISTRLGYKWEINRVFDIDDDADEEIQDLAGNQITSSITSTWIRDTLNTRRDPSRGTYTQLYFEYAGGILQGDNKFYKTGLEWSYYYELPRNIVWSLRGEIHYADSFGGAELPFYERFFLGGPQSMRGFRERSVGPWDINGSNLGGNKSLLFSSELQIPIAGPFKTVLFADAGDAYASMDSYELRSLRPSVGVELRFFVPGFWIPLRFIWGYNLDPYKDEDRNDFQFTMGTVL